MKKITTFALAFLLGLTGFRAYGAIVTDAPPLDYLSAAGQSVSLSNPAARGRYEEEINSKPYVSLSEPEKLLVLKAYEVLKAKGASKEQITAALKAMIDVPMWVKRNQPYLAKWQDTHLSEGKLTEVLVQLKRAFVPAPELLQYYDQAKLGRDDLVVAENNAHLICSDGYEIIDRWQELAGDGSANEPLALLANEALQVFARARAFREQNCKPGVWNYQKALQFMTSEHQRLADRLKPFDGPYLRKAEARLDRICNTSISPELTGQCAKARESIAKFMRNKERWMRIAQDEPGNAIDGIKAMMTARYMLVSTMVSGAYPNYFLCLPEISASMTKSSGDGKAGDGFQGDYRIRLAQLLQKACQANAMDDDLIDRFFADEVRKFSNVSNPSLPDLADTLANPLTAVTHRAILGDLGWLNRKSAELDLSIAETKRIRAENKRRLAQLDGILQALSKTKELLQGRVPQ